MPRPRPALLHLEVLWDQPVAEPAFARFKAWARNYVRAGAPEARAALEVEGLVLARARLTALADLIQIRPERALELAVPSSVRQGLPETVQALLEEPINALGDYEVVCVMPPPGREPETAAMIRSANFHGETYQVFTHGPGLEYVTRKAVPLNGVAAPMTAATAPPGNPIGLQPAKLLALSPSPARLLDASEVAALQGRPGQEPLCLATGQPWSANGTPVGIELGGQVYPFSALALAEDWAGEAMAEAGLDTPQTPSNLPTAESTYTEGRKRFLLLRVDFPDYTTEAMSTNAALTLMNNLSNFMAEISYYKHIVAPVGQGSDITPTMRMSTNASAYDNAGLSKLYPEARNVARDTYGYDLNKYDFCFVVTGGRPSYGYAGLGYVGGVGFHLANGYFDVRTTAHEFGHNLGLGHANWWDTSGQSMIGSGSSEEYGDSFDTMGGSGGGVRHFSSFFKNKLNWIPNSDCPTVTSSGAYRLYAQDIAQAPVGVRGLRINRASGSPYWVEFRQLWTGNKALMNGVSLRWVSGSTILLDTTPGSSGGKDDHPLTIGRTFSDKALGFHLTPLGKANTYPESLDVVVNLGAFPTNLPPTVRLGATTTNASTGQAMGFTATGSDPNGDPLAYFWDFGDGDYSTDNQATVAHSFGSAGEYYVECTVSDLKGGTAREGLLVRIGNPATFTISGRVLDTNNLPVTGIKVSVDASHYAFTESDGSYTLSRLGAGNYTVSALETVYNTNSFLHPFFNNPVTLGPSVAAADFVILPGSLEVYDPIVAKESSWKYLDNGSDQGTNWIVPAFNDTGWSNGTAILGYGQGNETTVISYGTNSSDKYITSYFRKTFTVANPGAFTNLLLEVLRDDGVIVYLNGAEIFRNNMPTNEPITFTTPAVASVEPDAYLQQSLPASVLRADTNVLAVEIHQVEPTSSDINFDLALSGLSVSNAAGMSLVYVASPAPFQSFTSPTNVAISAFARSAIWPVTLVEFYADGVKIGADATSPYSLIWTNPALGVHTLKAVATLGSGLVTSAPVAISVVAPVYEPPPVALSLITTGAVWNYLAGPTAAPPTWASLNFDDRAWTNGRGQLGYGENDEQTRVPYGPDINNKWITTYFRRYFTVNDPTAITNLSLRLMRDDGAVVYLNGVEVLRDMIAPGPVTYATLATNVPDDGQIYNFFTLNPAPLVNGTNLLAVEIHQTASNSSDLSFDLALDALAATNRARGLWLTSPSQNAVVALPGQVGLVAQAVAGGTLGLRKIEFLANGVKLGEAAAPPYSLVWSNPPGGVQQLTAVATDSAGGSVTSAPVIMTVTAPPLGTALISFGEVWRYLDDGSNPATNWSKRNFDDRAWPLGAAPLGYGGDGETTIISYGTNGSQRQITSYYRKAFTVANPAAYGNLLLRLVRDDGAVVYLNGQEVARDNLKAGLISFNSLATNTINAPGETTPVDFNLSPTNLLAGTNVIAVEIHQVSITSSDAGFDLALYGLVETNTAQGIYLASPADGTHFNAPANIPLSAYAFASGTRITLVEYFAGSVKIGQATNSPYPVVWSNAPVGSHLLTARATYGIGLTMVSPAAAIAVGVAPPPVQPIYETLIVAGSSWKFWDNTQPVAADWTNAVFDETAWPEGPARFGWGYDGEKTELTDGRITHYFRKWFTMTNPALYTELSFQLVRDDGAVVYLNGREVYRSNMPTGAVTAATVAATTVNTPDETTFFETLVPVPGSGLLPGSNLVAVELHQSSATSSDAGFDFQLMAAGTTEGRIFFATPAHGSSFLTTAAIALEAYANAPTNTTVTKVEFFSDGFKLGESAGPLYQFNWTGPTYGIHALVARLTAQNGAVVDSTPIYVTVTRVPASDLLVRTNAVWWFLDDGSNQGTNWAQPSYNDSAWHSGVARLGYGGDGEVTPVSYGPNSNNKYITTYFRHPFVVGSAAVYTSLTFRLLRDDGAVVWLNGKELYRSNLPTNPPAITYTTLASAVVSTAEEQTFFTTVLPATNLVVGTNWLAVEVHQNVTNSSDLGFALELTGVGYVADTTPPILGAALVGRFLNLSWPAETLGWRVYYAPSLATPLAQWTPIPTPPAVVNGRQVLDLSPAGSRQFFQLRKP